MSNEELKSNISEFLPGATFDESGEFLNVIIASEELLLFMQTLRSKRELNFDIDYDLSRRLLFTTKRKN